MTVAKLKGKVSLYHGECFAAWKAHEVKILELFPEMTADEFELSHRVHVD